MTLFLFKCDAKQAEVCEYLTEIEQEAWKVLRGKYYKHYHLKVWVWGHVKSCIQKGCIAFN